MYVHIHIHIYTYNRTLTSKKEGCSIICSGMDEPENVMLSEISRAQKDNTMVLVIWGI
jgi:hypothetical protein